MSKRLLGIGALAAAALFAGAASAQQGPIKIGLITDKVGLAKPYAEPVAAGAVFAVARLNAAGGVLGRKLELLVEDDQGVWRQAQPARSNALTAGPRYVFATDDPQLFFNLPAASGAPRIGLLAPWIVTARSHC